MSERFVQELCDRIREVRPIVVGDKDVLLCRAQGELTPEARKHFQREVAELFGDMPVAVEDRVRLDVVRRDDLRGNQGVRAMHKAVSRDDLVKAFAKWDKAYEDDPDAFAKDGERNPEVAADYFWGLLSNPLATTTVEVKHCLSPCSPPTQAGPAGRQDQRSVPWLLGADVVVSRPVPEEVRRGHQ